VVSYCTNSKSAFSGCPGALRIYLSGVDIVAMTSEQMLPTNTCNSPEEDAASTQHGR
jgi:hypothetical protein